MTTELEKLDILRIGSSRIGHQYANSEKFGEFVKLTLEPIVEVQDALFSVLDIDLDTAKGIKLDLIGRIVGAPAVIPGAIAQPFFGFEDQDEALEFGETDDPEAGGFFREVGQSSNTDYILNNEEYKKVVTAQIIKNNSDCSPDDVIKVVGLLIDSEFKYYELDMAIVIAPKQHINQLYRRLIEEMTPLPAGVSLAVLNGKYESLTLSDYERHLIYFNDY